MKTYKLILVLSILSSCNNDTQTVSSADGSSVTKPDSCQYAVPFANTAAAEALVDTNYSGKLNNYWGEDTTKLDFVHFFEHGKLVSSKFYYENGQVQEEYSFLCGALHGIQKFYYENGQLSQLIPYRYGRTNGIGRYYDDKGILLKEVTLVNDSLITSP